MKLDASAVIQELDQLLGQIEPKVKKPERATGYWFAGTDVERRAMRTRSIAAIERLAPAGSTYVHQARALDAKDGADGRMVVLLAGIIRGLRDDYAAGYMKTVEELVRAALIADLVGMAEELLSKGYKDAAAVITGSVLEEHLRRLATKHDVPVVTKGRSVRADKLNADLMKAGGYSAITQKSVLALLALRNSAAHGHYDEYDEAQVAAMIRDVLALVERLPA